MRTTIRDIMQMKKRGQRIPMLTSYDYTSAKLVEAAGVPIILVGDSLGQVVLGYGSTIPVTLDEMLHHTKAVVRGTSRALVVTDLPFMTYHLDDKQALHSAGRCLQEGGAQAVKLEGGAVMAPTARRLTQNGIPVMGHLGLTPQSVNQLGGYRVQGKLRDEADRLMSDAVALGRGWRLLPGAGAGGGARGPRHHGAADHPHHRHWGRALLRRPGAGAPRHAGAVYRLRSQAREALRGPGWSHQERRGAVRPRGAGA